MLWIAYFALVVLIAGSILGRLFIDGVVDLVREKRDRS